MINSIFSILVKYINDDILMLLTQVVIIWWAEHFRDNASLIQAANRCDKRIINYLEMRSEIIPILTTHLITKAKLFMIWNLNRLWIFMMNTKQRKNRERLLIIFDLNNCLVIEPILIWITIISMLTFYDTLAKYNKSNAFPSAIRRVYRVNWTKWAIDFVFGKSISTMQNFKLRFIHDANK